ncbi:NAD-dependent methanol dehydrogenase [Paraconexibacter sp. AEG42_29]|uniref:NAD-dependent methanol dehydrogenase n=1 Tax=Paraconexibacter sp. AEG42_29 TaxID=2997339 RepID=A0AAU7ATQ8_9ACTN
MTEQTTTAAAPSGTFLFPQTSSVRYGPGSIAELGPVADELGAARVFAITTGWVDGLQDQLAEALGDRYAGAFLGTEMHVPRSSVLAAAEAAREAGADAILSVGGGTQIDCASAVGMALACDIRTDADFDRWRVRYTYPDDLHVPDIPAGVVPHISIPTTLSGAESTNIFGVTDPARHTKDAYKNAQFVAHTVILDPELTVDVPDWLWASSGMRAVDHALEGILSKRHMPMADALGVEGLRIIAGHLEHSAANPSDVHARMTCQLGAWLSIYAATNVGVGLSHGLGHQLAAQFGMIHGVTSACMLPHVMAFNADVTAPRLARIAEALGAATQATPEAESAAAGVAAVREFVDRLEPLGVPHTLQAAGARYDELPDVADHALTDLSVAVNPKPVTRDDLIGLLQAAWS